MQNDMVPAIATSDNLDAYIEKIKTLSKSYDDGDRTDECYRAKIASMIWEHGYCQAMEDVQSVQMQTALLFSHPMGNA